MPINIEPDPNEFTKTERVAKLTWWLAHGDAITVRQAAELTGCTWQGALYILQAMSRVVPIYCADGLWQACAIRELEM